MSLNQGGLDELIVRASARPWRLDIESEGDWEHGRQTYCRGILNADGAWVIRFDDDYGTDQWADAELIVALVNGTVPH